MAAELALEPNLQRALNAVARLLRERWGATDVVLFGSAARGEATADSDLDLLVLLPQEPTPDERRALRADVCEVELAEDAWIDLLVVAADDWCDGVYQVLPIRQEVQRDGVRL